MNTAFLSMESTTPAWSTKFTKRDGSNKIYSRPCELEAPIFTCLAGIIALVGLVGNGLVLWLLSFRVRRNAISVYILNLAGADFLLLCFPMIQSLNKLTEVFHYSFFIPNVFVYVLPFSHLAGLSMLSTISTEHCLSVLWPIWYRYHRPGHMSAIVCGLLWALALLLSTLDVVCEFWYTGHRNWCKTPKIILCAWLTVLLVVLCDSSLTLLIRFPCGSRRMRMSRLYVTILLTVLAFLVCGLPLDIVWFSYVWMQLDGEVNCYLFLGSLFLMSVNSSTNPIIYFFVGSFTQQQLERRQTLKQVLQRALQDTPELDECGGSAPQGPLELSESR
ncbi:mas-related G-protein coupled receptor member X2-like [Lemur catta]|uniref:mas-related G-protein coupled receptor member X2-like n=1 Tax=Lemur catta TaxID=9447 RepID=UPI001E268E2E|nr:mas-related G-protein coupled receptor member X2-like [Lemur catta]